MSLINWDKFRSKKIGLLGAGKENISLIPFLVKHGADVTICEQNTEASNIERLEKITGVELRIGTDAMSEIGYFDYVFRTPGMPVDEVDRAIELCQGSPVRTSAVDLFLEFYSSQTIGVTGTKGKGTTSSMISSILRESSRSVLLAGNIGNSIFDDLDDIDTETLIVMELSSFQLEDINHSPHIAVLLPVTSDHLQPLSDRSPNYHRSLEDYIEAKRQIVAFQSTDDIAIFAADSQTSAALAESSSGKKIGVGKTGLARLDGSILSFGSDNIDLSTAGVKGDHLLLDASLASIVGLSLGASLENIIEGLSNFKPLPHRMQEVATINGVRYVDDSYATAPDATIYALTAFDEPIVLIAGGSSKGADFTELAKQISKSKVAGVVLLGQEAQRMKKLINQYCSNLYVNDQPKNLAEALSMAESMALKGYVVLLSPACASKDMFKDAADRGEKFTELVKNRMSNVVER